MLDKPVVIVSAVSIVEGGTLAILEDCLEYVASNLTNDYRVIALVNSKRLFKESAIEYVELSRAKRTWLNRLYYEYIHFARVSKKEKPVLWLSLHDMTPNVKAERRAVYCHCPAPFYTLSMKQAVMDFRFLMFNYFYRYLYMINIKKNDYVIVQQRWLRRKFEEMYKPQRVLVARPCIPCSIGSKYLSSKAEVSQPITQFIYPTLPRVFKNVELIGDAIPYLRRVGVSNIKIYITITGNENKYARWIFKRYSLLEELEFIGLQAREAVFSLYEKVDAMIFPSTLETWGLPLTEFTAFQKPILVSDLPYAHETLASYPKAKYLDPQDPEGLATQIVKLKKNSISYDINDCDEATTDCYEGWNMLFSRLLDFN